MAHSKASKGKSLILFDLDISAFTNGFIYSGLWHLRMRRGRKKAITSLYYNKQCKLLLHFTIASSRGKQKSEYFVKGLN